MKINKVFYNPVFYSLIVIVLFFDQLTKILFEYKNIIIIPDLLTIEYAENPGIIFGFFENNLLFLFLIPLFVIGLVIYYINEKEINYIGGALIIAGLAGNIIDRARLGYVIDWLFIHIIPEYNISLFNIADASLIAGIIISIYFIYKK